MRLWAELVNSSAGVSAYTPPRATLVFLDSGNNGSSAGPPTNPTNALLYAQFAQDDAPSTGRLQVGPNYIPPRFWQPLWVIATSPPPPPPPPQSPPPPPPYDWAVLTSGPPTVPGQSPFTCAMETKPSEDSLGKSQGVYLLARSPTPPAGTLEALRSAAASKGLDLTPLANVTHDGCLYPPFPMAPAPAPGVR